ncbi:MAG: hypothetical protein Aurels2KO_04780 [Aureliella sp.]
MLPGDISYTLNLDFGVGISRSLNSTVSQTTNTMSIPLPAGTTLLYVQALPKGDTEIDVQVSCDGATIERSFENSFGFFDPENEMLTTKTFLTHTAGISQTETADPLKPMMLAFREATNSKTGKNPVIRIWIGPIPGTPTEPSDR